MRVAPRLPEPSAVAAGRPLLQLLRSMLLSVALLVSLATAASPSLSLLVEAAHGARPPAASALIQAARVEQYPDHNVTVHGDAKQVCQRALSSNRWHPYFGAATESAETALACFADAAAGRECMRHINTLISAHFDGGEGFVDRLSRELRTVVQLSPDLEGEAGVCEVAGEGTFVPYVRLRSFVDHHTGSRRSRHRQRRRAASRQVRPPPGGGAASETLQSVDEGSNAEPFRASFEADDAREL